MSCDKVFVLTPKGVITSVLSGAMHSTQRDSLTEELMERLYLHAAKKAGGGRMPAIAFIDGQWAFVGIERQEE